MLKFAKVKSAIGDAAAVLGFIPSVDSARAALEQAEANLRASFDNNESEAKVVAKEEAVREARRVLTRAEHAAASVQRKLTAAEQAEADRRRADLVARVRAGLEARTAGAADIERGAALIAAGKANVDSAADVIREAIAAKLFSGDCAAALRDMQALIRFSLIAAGATPGPVRRITRDHVQRDRQG